MTLVLLDNDTTQVVRRVPQGEARREATLRDLIAEDRVRRGVKAWSADVDALAEEVQREPAWLEIVLLVVAVAFFVFALVF